MSDDDRPLGHRFSHVYTERCAPLRDSQRARVRAAANVNKNVDVSDWGELRRFLTCELGVNVRDIEQHFTQCNVQDFLDTITLVFRFLKKQSIRRIISSGEWPPIINRILEEENLHYVVDTQGGVHFKYDREFEISRQSSIAALAKSRYANAREQFEFGMSALSSAPPDGKMAIRSVFNAAECVFKLAFPNEPRLTAKAVKDRLEGVVQARYISDNTAKIASIKVLRSFEQWVDAAHNYRHEQGNEEPSQPPLELALLLVSQGAAFIRWLVALDSQEQT